MWNLIPFLYQLPVQSSFFVCIFSFFFLNKIAHDVKSNKSLSDEDILRTKIKMQMMIDEFIWISPFHFNHTTLTHMYYLINLFDRLQAPLYTMFFMLSKADFKNVNCFVSEQSIVFHKARCTNYLQCILFHNFVNVYF